jgi:hypothetical protein
MIDLRFLKGLVVGVVLLYALGRRLPFILDNIRRSVTYPLQELPPRDPFFWRSFEEQDETFKAGDVTLLEGFVVGSSCVSGGLPKCMSGGL